MREFKASVLCIDDEEMIRQTISDYLEDSGYYVLMAKDGKQGLEKFSECGPDIVLVDLRMPEMDGLEVLSAITGTSPDTPVIVISGVGVVRDVIQALRRGAWNYITKPIEDMAVLEFAVEQCLEKAVLIRKTKKYEENLEKMVEQRTRELEEANQHLRQAQKMEAIGTLAGGIAHDFNNTLGAILGYTELTFYKLPRDSPLRDNLSQVMNACSRAKDLVKQILTFSRKTKHKRIPVEVTSIVKEALRMLRATLPATIKIRQRINARMEIVEADPTQIHQVLMNLCTNAAHSMEEKGGLLEIGLRDVDIGTDSGPHPDLPAGTYVELSVKDTGHGISSEDMGRIFDPYFTTKRKEKGTGFGLSVVRGIAENHGGGVTVESEIGKGAVFYFYLPITKKKVGFRKSEMDNFPTGTERILFVDDEKPLADVGKMMLEQLGYRVRCENNAKRALETFRSDPLAFDLVITDLTMPNIKGDLLASEIVKIRADIPVLLSTGFDRIEIEPDTGIRDILTKPLRLGGLARKVRSVLDS